MNLAEEIKKDIVTNIKNSDKERLPYVEILKKLEIEAEKIGLKDIADFSNDQLGIGLVKFLYGFNRDIMNRETMNQSVENVLKEKEIVGRYISKIEDANIEIIINKTVEDYKSGKIDKPLNYAISMLHVGVDSRIVKQRLIDKGIVV